METIEIYKGIEIVKEKDPIYPYSTVETEIPLLGELWTGHRSVDAAKEYIDKIKEKP